MPTTMTQRMTIPVLFIVCLKLGHWTFFSSLFMSLSHLPMRAKILGFFCFSGFLSFFALSAFSEAEAEPWPCYIFSFSDIQLPFFPFSHLETHYYVSL